MGEWGRTIGKGLRSVQFMSTLSNELLVSFAYLDERLRTLRRTECVPGEEIAAAAWRNAAEELRRVLLEALRQAGVYDASVDIVGRWKRRCLVAQRDFVTERMELEDGRVLIYKQPEGQFSNPNAPCEVRCLDWLSKQAVEIRH